MTLDQFLATREDRCVHGFAPSQHPALCHCAAKSTDAEFAIFVSALHVAAGLSSDGLVHQTDMRPLIQRIPHKHRGTAYRKAVAAGLIEVAGKEPSTDAAGKNLDKDQRLYRLVTAPTSAAVR